MPRRLRIPDGTHREEQRRYREKLRRERVPEADQVDTAVAVGVRSLLQRVKAEAKSSKSADLILKDATAALVGMGYDRDAAIRLLRRRLVGENRRFDRLLGRNGRLTG